MKKLLVIDDNRDIADLVVFIFEQEGYEINCYNRGNGAIDKILSERPDVILLDINLGDMDGRDICIALKSNDNTKNIPVILFSAAIDVLYYKNEAHYPNDFLCKPFDLEEIVSKVNKQVNIKL